MATQRFDSVRRLGLIIGASVLLGSTAHAQWALDQQSQDRWFDYFNPDSFWAQTFTPTVNNISGVSLAATRHAGRPCDPNCPTTFSLFLSLWDGDPSQAASRQLAGDIVTFDTLWDQSHADLFFAPIGITAGRSYWIVFGQSNSPFLSLWESPRAPYGGGTFCGGGTSITDAWYCGGTNDVDFVTFYDPNFSTVPEPSTWALVVLGGVLSLAARRRRLGADA
ncbi:MAG: PEP-CTERM sorting domain-containing protein [Gemmatimonadaceae bacterium]|nr:PEP-CTERM sorting domain-containing protein [Gemmatimonadaceae bacterium]